MRKNMEAAGLETSDIDEVTGVIKGIFGLDFLEECAKKRGKNSNPFLQHPILIGCSGGSFMHLMELVELATYLMSFKDDAALPKIVSGLKKQLSYEDFMFPLAMAYRFKKLGFQVKLEPPINNGKFADFVACLGDLQIMAECTLSREWKIAKETRNTFFECQNIFKKIAYKLDKHIVLDIIANKYLNPESIEQLKKDMVSAGDNFLKSGNTVTLSNDLYTITLSTMNKDMDEKLKNFESKRLLFKDWDQIVLFSLGVPKIPGDVSTVDLSQSKPSSLLRYKSIISDEEEFAYSLEDVIDSKVSEKSSQLKSHPKDHISVLFLQVSNKLKKVDQKRVGLRLWNGIFQKIPSVNGVLLSEKDWIDKGKHQYQGRFFNNINNPMNEHLFNGFNIVEMEMDFVKEWRSVMKNRKPTP